MSERSGYEVVEVLAEENGVDETKITDVVLHNDKFNFLTRGDHVCAFKPIMNGQRLALDGGWILSRFVPALAGDDLHIRARYLVVSREELRMLVRFTPHPLQRGTCGFKVFREMERKRADACPNPNFPIEEYPWAWRELDTLDGRMLFVGHGCSRSYEVDQYPGSEAAIYFLDDGDQYDNAEIYFRHGYAVVSNSSIQSEIVSGFDIQE
ncbi:uncharacterized protein LOC120669406 [Panicum virgatum]|uniref:uncharacterized protein LOC120669406 n=1 Tax=Panicum virgatum TaxID=38727 RepID=UPI0019D631F2|nr:uncharacterized protein LOC120669406 [Panicum virgatum]